MDVPQAESEAFGQDLMKMLQALHKVAPVLATKDVSIEGFRGGLSAEHVQEAFVQGKKVAQSKVPYDVEKNYDCAHLMDTVLKKINTATFRGETTITLENRCCNLPHCPQVIIMQCFAEQLLGAIPHAEEGLKK